MKIGILTYHRAINYGAFLQCYSLVSFIRKNFRDVDVEVIDYENNSEFIVRLKSLLKWKGLKNYIGKIKMIRAFHRDQMKYLPLSKKRVVSNKQGVLSKQFCGEYDVIIVGSDAVWNNISSPAKLNYFLPGFNNCIKMSYAASTNGLNTSLLDADNIDQLNRTLSEFTYIGVREDKGVSFINRINSKLSVYRNCDPTCFIDLNDFPDEIILKFRRYGISLEKPIICLMTGNEKVGKAVYDNFHNSYQIIGIYTYNKYADIMLYDLSPSEFAVFFKHINLLFSFFFHGSYLCLKNGTPVIAVDEDKEPDGDITKIKFLFNIMNITSWYFRPNDMQDEDYDSMINTAREILGNSYSQSILNSIKEEEVNNISFKNSLTDIVNKIRI